MHDVLVVLCLRLLDTLLHGGAVVVCVVVQ